VCPFWEVPRRAIIGILGARIGTFDTVVGLIVRQQTEIRGKPWARVGICSWQDESDDPGLRQIWIKSREGNVEATIPTPQGLLEPFSEPHRS
jgi:hypothetical protein